MEKIMEDENLTVKKFNDYGTYLDNRDPNCETLFHHARSPEDPNRIFDLYPDNGIITIGRSSLSDIVIPGQYRSSSGNHGIFFISGKDIYYQDKSSNGTSCRGFKEGWEANPDGSVDIEELERIGFGEGYSSIDLGPSSISEELETDLERGENIKIRDCYSLNLGGYVLHTFPSNTMVERRSSRLS
tara:strand:+ start:349 stop:906 length:558 start_codon:yes stop_codon:yes gene_type:complete